MASDVHLRTKIYPNDHEICYYTTKAISWAYDNKYGNFR